MLKQKKYTLKQLRQLAGFTQEELGVRIGMTERTISKYENNVDELKKISYEKLKVISSVLGVEVDDIFLGETSDKPTLR